MSKKNEYVTEITNIEDDFAKWYTDIVLKAELADYSDTKGCIVIRPYGYKIWENIKNCIDKELKIIGIEIQKDVADMAGSAADEAGIKEGDVIVAIDSVKTANASEVQEQVNRFHPGDRATMTVIRDGKEKVLEVTFKGTAAENGSVDEDGGVAFYGARIKEAPKETLERLGIRHGVEIVSVGPGKVMDAGVSEGFIMMYVNDQPVSKPQDVMDIIKKSKRAVFVEGMTPYGKVSYFGFGI